LLAKEEIIPLVFDPKTDEGLDAFAKAAKGLDVGMYDMFHIDRY
jgi:hypothetical protein